MDGVTSGNEIQKVHFGIIIIIKTTCIDAMFYMGTHFQTLENAG